MVSNYSTKCQWKRKNNGLVQMEFDFFSSFLVIKLVIYFIYAMAVQRWKKSESIVNVVVKSSSPRPLKKVENLFNNTWNVEKDFSSKTHLNSIVFVAPYKQKMFPNIFNLLNIFNVSFNCFHQRIVNLNKWMQLKHILNKNYLKEEEWIKNIVISIWAFDMSPSWVYINLFFKIKNFQESSSFSLFLSLGSLSGASFVYTNITPFRGNSAQSQHISCFHHIHNVYIVQASSAMDNYYY